MVSVKQIAALAGVSSSTVFHVLHGRTGKMSKETLVRVQKILQENNYATNMSGRMLRKSGSRIIGVVISYRERSKNNALQLPFFSEIIGALEQNIRTSGYFMMFYIAADLYECMRMVMSWNVEGLIAFGFNNEECRQFIQATQKAEVPLVFIDSYFQNSGTRYFNVGLEDRRGGYIMTDYLISQGHRRIAFLADARQPVGVDHERLEGFKAALAKHHLIFLPEDYRYLSQYENERHAILRQFAEKDLHSYTALFFASDFLANDAINVFYDEGIRVPQDISVAGFDDNVFALSVRPRLTTVKQEVSQKAFYAVKQIMGLLRKEEPVQDQISLPVTLVVRESVAAVAVS